MAELSIEERVANGVEWLDRELPAWLGMIEIEQLDLGSQCNCILGQTFGDFWDAPEVHDGRSSQIEQADRGFNAYPPDSILIPPPGCEARCAKDYAHLTDEWKRVITARRETAADLKARSGPGSDA